MLAYADARLRIRHKRTIMTVYWWYDVVYGGFVNRGPLRTHMASCSGACRRRYDAHRLLIGTSSNTSPVTSHAAHRRLYWTTHVNPARRISRWSENSRSVRLHGQSKNSFSSPFHHSLLCPRPHRAEALSDDARLTFVCLSVAYIGPKLRTERPRKTKIGRGSPRHM